MVGVFGYSDEDGTEAEGYDGKLAQDVVAERVSRLTDLVEQLTAQRAEERVGEIVEVLVELVEDGEAEGRAAHQGPDVDGVVRLPAGDLAVGDLVLAEVTGSEGVDLLATFGAQGGAVTAASPTPAAEDPIADQVGTAPIWNLANALTAVRLVLVPVFGVLLLHDDGQQASWRVAAFVAFFVASITDRFDGELARRRGLVTDVGKIADPIADKALIGMALVGLSLLGELPWWVTIVVLVREVGITVLRFVVIRHGVMPASRGGKVKTFVQALAIGLYVLPREVDPAAAGRLGGHGGRRRDHPGHRRGLRGARGAAAPDQPPCGGQAGPPPGRWLSRRSATPVARSRTPRDWSTCWPGAA